MMKEKKELTAQQAREKALRLLEFRSHSEKELSDKLVRAGAKRDDLPPIIEFLKEYGFLNDADYAKGLARDMQNLKKLGKRRISQELRAKGISSEALEDALCELSDEEEDALFPLVEKKLGGDFDKKNVDRAIRYFLYRGYGFDDIKACIDRLKSDYFED